MIGDKASPKDTEKDERKLPQDFHIDDENSKQPVPPFLNDGPELVRDSHC